MCSFINKIFASLFSFTLYSILILFLTPSVTAQTCSDLCPPATYPNHIYPACALTNPDSVECILADPSFTCDPQYGDYCYCCRSYIWGTPTSTPVPISCDCDFNDVGICNIIVAANNNCGSLIPQCYRDPVPGSSCDCRCVTPTPTPIGWSPTSTPTPPPCDYAYCTEDTCSDSRCSQCSFCTIVATPPPLPPTDWSLLYRTLQPTPGLFTFSSALTVGGVISPMLRIIFPIAGLILLLMIIYGGYNWMLSAGDPKKAARAKEIITVALIGFIIIFTSYWLVQIIGSILGLGTIGIIF